MPTILTKKSDTPGSVPATANLTNAAGGAELAVNTADKRLFTISSGSQVVELGTNPSSITCADGSFTVARIGSGTVTQLTSTSATITTLTGTSAGITTISSGSANITQLNSTSATISTLTSTSASITNLTATSLVLSNLSIASANVTTLTSASATITNLLATTLTISSGTANGVLYLNASKVATSGSALQFSGTNLSLGAAVTSLTWGQFVGVQANYPGLVLSSTASGGKKWSIGADAAVLTFRNETDSTTAAVIDGSNNLGIGTSSPASKLEVLNSGDSIVTITGNTASGNFASVDFKRNTGTVNAAVRSQSVGGNDIGEMYFMTRPNAGSLTERMRIDATGNVGIGTSSPAARLEVSGSLTTTANVSGLLTLGRYDAGTPWSLIRPSSDSSGFEFRSFGGTAWMNINSSGNVGIGTSSPAYKLDVAGAINSSADIISQGNDARISLYRSAGINYFDWSSGQSLYFSTQTSAGGAGRSTKMVLTDGGNLGIGTSSPGYKLEVASGSTDATALFDSTNANGSHIRLASSGTVKNYIGCAAGFVTGGAADDLGLRAVGKISFATNGAAADMVLDTSGNLGLGVTPSAWYSGAKAFQFGGTGAIFNNGTNVSYYVHNAYFDTGWKYIGTGFANYFAMDTGVYKWYTAPSGTAGNAITFTQAMTLDASGNLSVKTTTSRANITTDADLVTQNGLGILSTSTTYGQGYQYVRFFNSAAAYAGSISQTAATGIGLYSASDLIFGSSSTERARITSGGYFKASDAGTYQGSTNSYHELRQTADSAVVYLTNTRSSITATASGIRMQYTAASPNGTDNYFLYCDDSTALRAGFRSNGGLANFQSNNVDLSDARTKKDIAPAASMWGKIGALEIVTYKYNDQTHDDVNVGVIAQQVESVEPVWVDADGFGETPEGEEPLKTVYTKDITFAAIKALQEAMARIEKLEAEVAAMKGA